MFNRVPTFCRSFGGNDAADLQTALGESVRFSPIDVHKKYYPAPGNSLASCIDHLMNSQHQLDKTWRLSGWDVTPLRQGQLEYAALDVVCCHVLYLVARGGSSLEFSDGVYRIVKK